MTAGFAVFAAYDFVAGFAAQTPQQGMTLSRWIVDVGGWASLIFVALVFLYAVFRTEPWLVTGGRWREARADLAECHEEVSALRAENRRLWEEKVDDARRAALAAETFAEIWRRQQDGR